MAIVETRQGKVDGEQNEGLFVFRGIPTASSSRVTRSTSRSYSRRMR